MEKFVCTFAQKALVYTWSSVVVETREPIEKDDLENGRPQHVPWPMPTAEIEPGNAVKMSEGFSPVLYRIPIK